MGVEILLEAVRDGEYDPRCTRIEVALRAIWLLYRRGKWDLLGQAGLDEQRFEPLFWTYADTLPTYVLRTDTQALQFLRFIRACGHEEAISLLAAAVWMVGQYMTRRRRVRAAWYGKDLPVSVIYHIERDNDSAAFQTLRQLPKLPGMIEAYVAPSFHPERRAFVVVVLDEHEDPQALLELGAVKVEEQPAEPVASAPVAEPVAAEESDDEQPAEDPR